MADSTRSDTPRLYIAHYQASHIDHTGVGKYEVTMSLRVEMVNAQKEMVHAQFLVDGTAQGYPQLIGDDGRCEQVLVLAPATQPQISVVLSWRHDPSPTPVHLCALQVPTHVHPGEKNFFEGRYWKRQREKEARKLAQAQGQPRPPLLWEKIWAWLRGRP
jgi:hypothetical protein